MGGVSELSVAKVVLGFVIVVGYVAYCGYLVWWVGVFSGRAGLGQAGARARTGGRMSSFCRRARFARGERTDTELGRFDVESVVIGMDVGKEGR
jgi:hypothetical protein